jgi:TolB-like protein
MNEQESVSGAVNPRLVERPAAWKSALLVLAALAVLVGASIGAVFLFSGGGRRPAETAAPSGQPLLAILNFQNRTGQPRYDRYAVSATEALTAALSRPGAPVDLVSTQRLMDELQAVNAKNGASNSALDLSAAIALARRCGARYLLRGELRLLEGELILTSQVIEAPTGRVVFSRQVNGLDDNNLLDKLDELGRLFREDLKGLV